jgi:hypothetical protein
MKSLCAFSWVQWAICDSAIVFVDFTLIPPSAGPACYTLLSLVEIKGANLDFVNLKHLS